MMLEYDNAYRYRFQDIFMEIDMSMISIDTALEIKRVLGIAIKRDFTAGNKLSAINKFLNVFLWFNKDISEFIKSFILGINPEEIKMDEGDWYWCGERWDYNFRDVSYEDRKRQRAEIDDRLASERVIKIPEKIEPFIGLAPNKEFFNLNQDEAEQKVKELSEDFIKNTFPKVKEKII